MKDNDVLVSFENVSKSYQGKSVLANVSFSVKRGEILCFLGESGGGKSTILNLIAGLLAPDGGKICYPNGKIPKVSYSFQEGALLPNLSALNNLTFVGGKKEDCIRLLEQFELSEKANKRPYSLSGGEKQRVALARSFASPFDLLLADEPFSALDIALRDRIMRLFLQLLSERSHAEGEKSAVFVTHSVKEAIVLADRIAVLRGGKIVKEAVVGAEKSQAEIKSELIAALTED